MPKASSAPGLPVWTVWPSGGIQRVVAMNPEASSSTATPGGTIRLVRDWIWLRAAVAARATAGGGSRVITHLVIVSGTDYSGEDH